ncbi:ABC transporter [Nakamurella deserti]|uniref:ABC transporter n=1 Tax=Nakamurella deserti TaxID=2164074 RepID=UPI000DBE75C4|nr:ABC transporter [Nakamurella deserti]
MPAPPQPPRPVITAAVLALALGLTLCACSGSGARSASGASAPSALSSPAPSAPAGEDASDAPGHGAIPGAAEMTEPQLRLAVVAPDGSTSGIDLLTGDSVELPDLPAPTAVTTDGRYLFATSASGLTVVDSGVWTVPHGDHSHYYLAESRPVGEVDGGAAMRTSSAPSLVTVLDPDAGRAVVLDGAALGAGSVALLAELDDVPADGLLVPSGRRLVQTTAGSAGSSPDTVRVLDAAGAPVAGTGVACPGAGETITSRVGVVVGCADGAVLAVAGSDPDGTVALEHIPYPAAVSDADRARDFRARKDRPVVAAVAGERGAWVLDTRDREWRLIETGTPLVAVSAVDDRDHVVVAVDRAGRVLTLDARTGVVTGTSEPLLADTMAEPALRDAVTIEVDAARAYVNDPAGRRILEIDHGDAARISREFPTPDVPMFLAEVGR